MKDLELKDHSYYGSWGAILEFIQVSGPSGCLQFEEAVQGIRFAA